MEDEMLEIIIREYISKCNCCDECVAYYFCTLNERRTSRYPDLYCTSNMKDYLVERVTKEKDRISKGN